MTEPLVFASRSPRFGLPLLFAGQAQKEFFVNEALCRADSLLHPAVEEERSDPPEAPEEGQSWLIGPSPTGIWADKAGSIASYQLGAWLFIAPENGLQLLDLATGQRLHFHNGWQRPETPAPPTGGSVVDAEVRQCLAELLDALAAAGILQTP